MLEAAKVNTAPNAKMFEVLRSKFPDGKFKVLDVAANVGEPGMTIAETFPSCSVHSTDLAPSTAEIGEHQGFDTGYETAWHLLLVTLLCICVMQGPPLQASGASPTSLTGLGCVQLRGCALCGVGGGCLPVAWMTGCCLHGLLSSAVWFPQHPRDTM